jgi:hypothetical protein
MLRRRFDCAHRTDSSGSLTDRASPALLYGGMVQNGAITHRHNPAKHQADGM